ncbi:MAG: sulfatase-like hydrolase/transferase, partial [Bacteroidales bacterium]|nr:sulfatase-like hydrolase/transferase [Bacteroidales bacterium]
MKKRILTFLLIYVYFIFLFLFAKILFLFYRIDIYSSAGLDGWCAILWHGLSMDLSAAGYLSVFPGILILASFFLKKNNIITLSANVYFLFICLFLAILIVADAALFGYWGTRLDRTVFIYMDNMKDVFASISSMEIVLGIAGMSLCFLLTFVGYRRLIFTEIRKFNPLKGSMLPAMAFLLLLGTLFIPIRGGITTSTMNTGHAYFSSNANYNQAAVNTFFNFGYSLMKLTHFSTQFHYFPDTETEAVLQQLSDRNQLADSIPQLLTMQRPNILLFVLESFGATVIEPLGGVKDVTPNMKAFAADGILFSQFYANSFRTDRGLVSILSGYPAQAMTSIMKYPNKTQSLPSIPKTLIDNGYNCELFYGGDIDFAGMRS